jgi:hypothetical protein
VSSFNETKRQATEKELKRRDAAGVYFCPISATHSMMDKIDVTPFINKVDIVLIAGGIGSANLLVQCEPLNVLCIDSGFCLECIADPFQKRERIFCEPDVPF